MDEQLLRVVLPTRLLADVDRQLATEGSVRTRADFVREAVEQRLLELSFGAASSESNVSRSFDEPSAELRSTSRTLPHAPRSASPMTDQVVRSPLEPRVLSLTALDQLFEDEEIDLSKDPLVSPRSLADTRLPAPASAAVMAPSTPSFPVEAGPLFLHGRDYPSLWALWWLARRSSDSPPELAQFLAEATALAWTYAQALGDFDHVGALRVTTMFPRSTRNPDSASQTFQAAAIGALVRRRDGSWRARGPLPMWNVAAIWEHESSTRIAPTQIGLDLLARLDGISLELPHTEEQTEVFLNHLREHAEADYALFVDVLRLVADEPDREQLVAEVGSNPRADTKLGDVFAQSYVARGREWGLVEPKLLGGRYRLTERGRAMI